MDKLIEDRISEIISDKELKNIVRNVIVNIVEQKVQYVLSEIDIAAVIEKSRTINNSINTTVEKIVEQKLRSSTYNINSVVRDTVIQQLQNKSGFNIHMTFKDAYLVEREEMDDE